MRFWAYNTLLFQVGLVYIAYSAAANSDVGLNGAVFALVASFTMAFTVFRPYFNGALDSFDASIVFILSTFAIIAIGGVSHSVVGVCPTFVDGCVRTEGEWHTGFYFSVVTFTTLGYGDFRPVPEARLLAISQALVGYLYLGLLVGSAIHWAQRDRP